MFEDYSSVWRLLFLACCVCGAGELKLRVQDASGAPMAAQGFLESRLSGQRLSFAVPASGDLTISGVREGAYLLRLQREGFETRIERIDIPENGAREASFRLAPGTSASRVDVVAAAPLAGMDRALEDLPSSVRSASAEAIQASGALELSDFLNRRMGGVYLNEVQGNPFQPDLNFRGYTASPLLGTPQGISIFQDGVRINQPFGDVVSWDLIPRVAISEAALIPASNPLFGLNTLGGAVSLRTKDGLVDSGTRLTLGGGSWGRRTGDLEHGAALSNGFNWYAASSLLFEDGWRETSNSSVRQFFGRAGKQSQRSSISLLAGYANNGLLGNGLQEFQLLERNYASVHTKPDQTANRSPYITLLYRRGLSKDWSLSSNAYFRHVRTFTLNGDINEDSLDQAVYQPTAAERAALAAAGFTGFPASGENAQNTPFPRWRCIANVLLQDEPAEKCNGLINRSASQQRNYGLGLQFSRDSSRHQFSFGGDYNGASVNFNQSSELGYLNPDRTITGLNAFGDGVSGGEEDGEPFDVRVNLASRIHSLGFFATDTFRASDRLNLTVSGRYNRAQISNLDRIRPQAGTGSLTGEHRFQRFNPSAGLSYRLAPALQFFANYSEGNRAPTAIELGCADPESPCKLPNALAGDPPLSQVVTRSVEMGLRGAGESRLHWSASYFRAVNRDDLLFVASEQTGFGYFKNFGQTKRQGLEFDAKLRLGRAVMGFSYTFLDATFQSEEDVNGEANSTNDDEIIEIEPGNRIPLTPRNLSKFYLDAQLSSRIAMHLNVLGVSGSFARGNENNAHAPSAPYFIGPGSAPGYGIVNLGGDYRIHRRAEVFVNCSNLFNKRFYSGAQLGPTGFTADGNFVARRFPAVDGEFPVLQSTFFAPGAPRAAWLGLRLRF
jgi:outer membrane receptor protein involved in Fe transport